MPKRVPFEFVLDELAPLSPRVRPMFGAHAVYIGDKFVVIVRERGQDDDDGVWIATSNEHHASLRRELPSLRTIGILGGKITSWQNLPSSGADFEREALHACALILRGDERIGKIPKSKQSKTKKAAPPAKAKKPRALSRAEAAAMAGPQAKARGAKGRSGR